MGPLHPPKFGPNWKKKLIQEPRFGMVQFGLVKFG